MHPVTTVMFQAAAEAVAITSGGSALMARIAAAGRRIGAEAAYVRHWLEANPEVLLIVLLATILFLAARALTLR